MRKRAFLLVVAVTLVAAPVRRAAAVDDAFSALANRVTRASADFAKRLRRAFDRVAAGHGLAVRADEGRVAYGWAHADVEPTFAAFVPIGPADESADFLDGIDLWLAHLALAGDPPASKGFYIINVRADAPLQPRDFGEEGPGTATVRPLDGGPPRGSFPVDIFRRGIAPPSPLGRRFHVDDEGVFQLCFSDTFDLGGLAVVGGCWQFR
jgi:hypothetical protein